MEQKNRHSFVGGGVGVVADLLSGLLTMDVEKSTRDGRRRCHFDGLSVTS